MVCFLRTKHLVFRLCAHLGMVFLEETAPWCWTLKWFQNNHLIPGSLLFKYALMQKLTIDPSPLKWHNMKYCVQQQTKICVQQWPNSCLQKVVIYGLPITRSLFYEYQSTSSGLTGWSSGIIDFLSLSRLKAFLISKHNETITVRAQLLGREDIRLLI